MSFKKYFDELKRRRVIKAAMAYAAVAWVLIQIASIVLPTFNAPEYILKVFIFLLIILFPIYLIFEWNYDITSDGIKKTENENVTDSSNYSSRGKFNSIIIGSLLIAIILLLINQYYTSPTKLQENNNKNSISVDTSKSKSIAVLPFKNFSGDQEMEPFCDGMTDEVISRLTKIKSFDKVSSSTSVFAYKNTDKSIPEIAKELGVTHILQGNFQKSSNQIKIKLQLIDGLSDDHFWTDDYVGEWDNNDIFRIQAEVAENVAKNMNVSISNSERESIKQKPTENKEAYNLYLQAEFLNKKLTKDAHVLAMELYEDVIEIDPNFTEAYLGLANIWKTGGLIWGLYPEKKAWKEAKDLLEKALTTNPESTAAIENLLNEGKFYYEWDFKSVMEYYKSMNKEDILNNMGSISMDFSRKMGFYQKSMEAVQMKIEHEPYIGYFYSFEAIMHYFMGNTADARSILKYKDEQFSDEFFYLRESLRAHYMLGDYDNAKKVLRLIRKQFNDNPSFFIFIEAVLAHEDGDRSTTNIKLKELKARFDNEISGSPAWFHAMYYAHIKDYDKTFEWLQKSYKEHEVEMTWLREEPLLKPVWDDPRYQKLYSDVGFFPRE